jgi:hypothetical protein
MYNWTRDYPRTLKPTQQTIGGGADEEEQRETEEQGGAASGKGGWRRRIDAEISGFLAAASQSERGPALLAVWERTNVSIRMVVRGVTTAGAIRSRKAHQAPGTELTPREREVLELVLRGCKAPAIAEHRVHFIAHGAHAHPQCERQTWRIGRLGSGYRGKTAAAHSR